MSDLNSSRFLIYEAGHQIRFHIEVKVGIADTDRLEAVKNSIKSGRSEFTYREEPTFNADEVAVFLKTARQMY